MKKDTALKLIQDLWWFIENVNEDTPDRTDRFFALRERVRNFHAAGGEREITKSDIERMKQQGYLGAGWAK